MRQMEERSEAGFDSLSPVVFVSNNSSDFLRGAINDFL